MDESRHIPQLYLAMKRNGLTERLRLFKAAGCSFTVHVALFAIVAAWPWEGRLAPPTAGVITVDIRELNLPTEQVREPEKVSAPRTLPTIVRPRPAQTIAQPAPEPIAPATPPAQAPVTLPAAGPAPAGFLPTPTASPVLSPPSTGSARGVPVGPPAAAPAPALPAGRIHAAPAPSPATSSRGGGGYLALCRGLIERNKNYPAMARRGRIEGTVTVGYVLGRDGSIRQSGVVRTSGSTLLDNAATRAVRSVGRFPPVPAEMHGEELAFEVPIAFRLSAE